MDDKAQAPTWRPLDDVLAEARAACHDEVITFLNRCIANRVEALKRQGRTDAEIEAALRSSIPALRHAYGKAMAAFDLATAPPSPNGLH